MIQNSFISFRFILFRFVSFHSFIHSFSISVYGHVDVLSSLEIRRFSVSVKPSSKWLFVCGVRIFEQQPFSLSEGVVVHILV